MILDSITAGAAYGLRKLRTAYGGNCILVRRSSDSTTQAIGFSGSDLDTASMLTFCGAGNGFVDTWYDQGPSGYDLVQATTTAQPQIVSSGALISLGGRATLQFGSSDFMPTPAGGLGLYRNKSYGEIYCVARNTTTNARRDLCGFTTNSANAARLVLWFAIATNNRLSLDSARVDGGAAARITAGADSSNNLAQFTGAVEWANAEAVLRQNGVEVASSTSFGTAGATSDTDSATTSPRGPGIGQIFLTTPAANVSECIFFNTDESANRSAIEVDQMGYFGLIADVNLAHQSPLIQSCRLHSKLLGA